MYGFEVPWDGVAGAWHHSNLPHPVALAAMELEVACGVHVSRLIERSKVEKARNE